MSVPGVSIQAVAEACAREFGISYRDLVGKDRFLHLILARQVAMYLGVSLLERSLPDVGHYLGGRDHTTVLYAHRKVERLIKDDPSLAERVERLIAKLSGTWTGPEDVAEEPQPVMFEAPLPPVRSPPPELFRATETYLRSRRQLTMDRYGPREGASIREEERAAVALGVAYHDYLAGGQAS